MLNFDVVNISYRLPLLKTFLGWLCTSFYPLFYSYKVAKTTNFQKNSWISYQASVSATLLNADEWVEMKEFSSLWITCDDLEIVKLPQFLYITCMIHIRFILSSNGEFAILQLLSKQLSEPHDLAFRKACIGHLENPVWCSSTQLPSGLALGVPSTLVRAYCK